MNTQYEKNSVYLAKLNYGMAEKRRRLRNGLVAFFALLSALCAVLYTVISSISI